jgi:hypothetical protein
MSMLAPVQSATTPTLRRSALALAARLRRLLNGWVAAVIHDHERQTTLLAQSRREKSELTNRRLYRGPIDLAVEKTARLRKQWRLTQP